MTHFIRNKRALYFLVTEKANIRIANAFKDMVADFTGNALLKAAAVDHWDLIFQSLVDSVTDERLIILIDEFQYLGKSNPAVSFYLSKNMGYYFERSKCDGDSLWFPYIYDGKSDPIIFQSFVWSENRPNQIEANTILILQ